MPKKHSNKPSTAKDDFSSDNASDSDTRAETDLLLEKSLSEGPIPEPELPKGINWSAVVLCLLIAFGGYISGWDTGTIGGYETQKDFLKRFGTKKTIDGNDMYYLTKIRAGLITGLYQIGCILGTFFLGDIGDKYGRRAGLIIGSCIFAAGTVIQVGDLHWWYQYMIGRLVSGFGYGVICVLSPMLIAELSPRKLRGALVSAYQLMMSLGLFLGASTIYASQWYHDSREWRLALSMQFCWCLFIIGTMMMVPESPRYLIEHGLVVEAQRAIARTNGISLTHPFVDWELDEIQIAVNKDKREGKAGWLDILSTKNKMLPRVIMGILIMGLQQLTGINFIFYYDTRIFRDANIKNGFESALAFGAVNFFCSILAVFFVAVVGRRKLLLFGSFGMVSCLVVFSAVGVSRFWPDGSGGDAFSKGAGKCILVFVAFFIFCFETTWGPVSYVIVSESFPQRYRSKAMTLAFISNHVWNFCVAFFTPFIFGSIHFSYGFVFMGCMVFAFFYVFFFVPETKGLQLEDVDIMWQEGILPWKSSRWIPPSQRGMGYDQNVFDHDDKPFYRRMFH